MASMPLEQPFGIFTRLIVLLILPTSCMSETPDLLAIHVSLVPDQPVDQARSSGIPALVQPSLDRGSDVNFGQTAQWGNWG